MTPDQIARVQSSTSKVEAIAEQAAGMFYDRFFEQNPELRALFGDNMCRQGLMLMQALSLAVKNLHQPDAIMEPLQAMGRRTSSTASSASTTRSRARRCSGRWSKAWGTTSTLRPATPGRRPTTCSPR